MLCSYNYNPTLGADRRFLQFILQNDPTLHIFRMAISNLILLFNFFVELWYSCAFDSLNFEDGEQLCHILMCILDEMEFVLIFQINCIIAVFVVVLFLLYQELWS